MDESPNQDFERLIDDHARLMSSAIRKVCRGLHRELIPDVEQEVRLALWKRMQSGKKIEHPTSYIYKVALTTALSVVKKMGTRSVAFEESSPTTAPGASTLETLAPAERAMLLTQALSKLEPDEERAVRAYLAGFNHREVAELYGWTESVARHKIYRSLESLAKKMKDSSVGNTEVER